MVVQSLNVSYLRPDVRSMIWEALDAIGEASTLESACANIARLGKAFNTRLLTVKLVDLSEIHEPVLPWTSVPDDLQSLREELAKSGGCIFQQEAMARLRPFLLSQVSRYKYQSLAERRYFVELDKLAYTDILAMPVVFGRGMALSIIGLNEELSNRARHSIVDAIGRFAAALLLRFPEVGRLFEERRLSEFEAEVLRLKSEGCTEETIRFQTGLGGAAIQVLLESAQKKLGARNHYELVRLATLLGELDPVIAPD